MSHRSSSAIHSRKGRALNGRAHCHQDQKRRGCSSSKPRWCWSLFLKSMELSMQNFCHKAKLLISTSTKRSCDVWYAPKWGRKEENCGKRGLGCFIMTMLQLIMPWEFGSFLPKITLLYRSHHPTIQIWHFVFFKLKEVIKGTRFRDSEAIKKPRRESSERSRRNPSRSAWKRGRGDWKSAFEPKEIILKATCCKIYLSIKIKHL